ncbi:hypothetical protein BRADI_3g06817v3 [Brachypodium distachyon]|uniref:Uncharacterized protein n=1 Tax=Brachypodium distachyon TaxID=15368 RepID=A0A2K2CVM3_BRADI|nr:hypothetical protein BRADI_3g06817v3 [Brachypodium distachyon]
MARSRCRQPRHAAVGNQSGRRTRRLPPQMWGQVPPHPRPPTAACWRQPPTGYSANETEAHKRYYAIACKF